MTIDERTLDAVFDALADDHRRDLLAYLQDANETSVDELATFVRRQADGARRGTNGNDIAVRLHHVHLPKPADADLVEYDRNAGRVEYVGGSEIAELLATEPRGAIPE
jgi:DNA-binding transcriptional ArsR family regulator